MDEPPSCGFTEGTDSTLVLFNEKDREFGYENWQHNLMKACVTLNSLKHSKLGVSAYEVVKNRITSGLEPLEFYPSPMERKVANDKLSGKVKKLYNSNLKVDMPVFYKGQKVKVQFPKKPARFGVVTATRDNNSKLAVKVKFPDQKPYGINKDFICLPRFKSAPGDSQVDVTNDDAQEADIVNVDLHEVTNDDEMQDENETRQQEVDI